MRRVRAAVLDRGMVGGLSVAIVIAAVAWIGGRLQEEILGHAAVESLVLALFIGAAVANTTDLIVGRTAGIRFASAQILHSAIALLGVTVTYQRVSAAGGHLIVAAILIVIGVLIVGTLVGLTLGLARRLSLLVSVGLAICGNSAVAAAGSALRAAPSEIALAIGLSAVLGLAQIVVLPLLTEVGGMDHVAYGVVVGLSAYAVPHALAAGFAVSPLAGEVATTVKLLRVLCLGPVIGAVAFVDGGGQVKDIRSHVRRALPWFVVAFLVLAAVSSMGAFPDAVVEFARQVSRLAFIVAMAGVGLEVDLRRVRVVGPRVLATIVITSALLLGSAVLVATSIPLDGFTP